MFFFIILTTSNIDTITLISDKLAVGSPRSPFERDHTGLSDCPFWGINLALNSNFPWLCSPNQGPTPHGPASFERHGREGHWCEAQTDLDEASSWGTQPHVSSVTFDDSPQQTEPWRHNTEHDKSWTQLNAEWKDKSYASYASTCCSSGSGTYTENESKEKTKTVKDDFADFSPFNSLKTLQRGVWGLGVILQF